MKYLQKSIFHVGLQQDNCIDLPINILRYTFAIVRKVLKLTIIAMQHFEMVLFTYDSVQSVNKKQPIIIFWPLSKYKRFDDQARDLQSAYLRTTTRTNLHVIKIFDASVKTYIIATFVSGADPGIL